MLTLIIFLITGLLIAYLTQYNSMLVTLNVGGYIFTDIPLFYVVIGSILVGLCLGYLFQLIDSLFTAISLVRKDKKIQAANKEVVELTKKIHNLELENERLKKTTEINLTS